MSEERHDPDKPRESLIEAAKAWCLDQPSFFPELLDSVEKEEDESGEFTGERLFARHPEKYRAIVAFLAEPQISEAWIARVCKVSRNTVSAVRSREGIPIEQLKEKILATARDAQLMTAERLVELIPTMSPRDAVIAFGVITEKVQLLSGEATIITGLAGAAEKAKHADFNSMLDALPAADAKVVEMGSSAGADEQKGGPLPLADRAAQPVMSPDTDALSVVSQSKPAGSNAQGNTPPAIDLESEGSDQQGGRGSAYGEGEEYPN